MQTITQQPFSSRSHSKIYLACHHYSAFQESNSSEKANVCRLITNADVKLAVFTYPGFIRKFTLANKKIITAGGTSPEVMISKYRNMLPSSLALHARQKPISASSMASATRSIENPKEAYRR